nr:hypothetical protein [Tanacetum cinerariifolium]
MKRTRLFWTPMEILPFRREEERMMIRKDPPLDQTGVQMTKRR